jgi:transposase-like protein
MGQHFLLSSAAKTLSLSAVARMSDDEARATFERIRFADNGGQAYCPSCGCAAVYRYKTRAVFKCKGCDHHFSITSGTIFADRKRPVRDYLLAIAIFVNGAKGVSALQLSRDLQCDYKTAFVLAHKLREAMAPTPGPKLGGVVEVDGAYFGGHIRPENRVEDRVDRRLAENQTGKRRCVVVIRERGGRTLLFVVKSEDEGVPLIRKEVTLGSEIHADEAGHWISLQARFDLKRIHHGKAYSADGACTNQAESWFSRLRRGEVGVHHHFGKHLPNYANEFAWREDNRRISTGGLFQMLAGSAARLPVSSKWAGYWQRHLHVAK